jgi:ABC-type amino acid transport substrate-binding protein
MNFVFVAKVGKYSSIDDCMVPGRRVAVTRATSPHNYIVTKPGIALTLVDDGADAIAAVNQDQVDCALTVTFRALSALLERGNKDAGLETVGNPFSPEGFSGGAGIIVPLHREELRDRLNVALRAALADGRYDALTNKFLPFSFY